VFVLWESTVYKLYQRYWNYQVQTKLLLACF